MGLLQGLKTLFVGAKDTTQPNPPLAQDQNNQPSLKQKATPVFEETVPSPDEQKTPKCGILYTITSDIGGTIYSADGTLNRDLVNFLCDAAEDGHDVMLVSGAHLDSAQAIFAAACHEIGRQVPGNISVHSKYDIQGMEADIAFDNEDFNYLDNKKAFLFTVMVDLFGTPDVPIEEIRKTLCLPANDQAATAKPSLQTRQP